MWFKLFERCDGCYKKRWLVRKVEVMLPIGRTATSKDYFCRYCFNNGVKSKLEKHG